MTSDEHANLDERLARLAARRVEVAGRPGRRHPARRGRIIATGLSSSAFFAIVATLTVQPSGAATAKVATAAVVAPTTGTTVAAGAEPPRRPSARQSHPARATSVSTTTIAK